jgi:hypothetical protein
VKAHMTKAQMRRAVEPAALIAVFEGAASRAKGNASRQAFVSQKHLDLAVKVIRRLWRDSLSGKVKET